MKGTNAETGRAIAGLDHLYQSIGTIDWYSERAVWIAISVVLVLAAHVPTCA